MLFGRGEPKGKVLPAKPRRKHQKKEHRKLIGQNRPRGLMAVFSRGVPKGKVLFVLPRHRRQKQHRDSQFGRPRGLIAFELYPFTPGEYRKARFYPFSPGPVSRSSTAIRILAGPGV